jgi:hypothetical protein
MNGRFPRVREYSCLTGVSRLSWELARTRIHCYGGETVSELQYRAASRALANRPTCRLGGTPAELSAQKRFPIREAMLTILCFPADCGARLKILCSELIPIRFPPLAPKKSEADILRLATLVGLHKLNFDDACFASHRNNDSR